MAEHPIINKRATTPDAITVVVIKSLVITGLRTIYCLNNVNPNQDKLSLSALHKNELHPCHSLRIFAVTNIQRAKVDKTIREMLVGHFTGFDKSYYKPQDSEILEEYLKAVDSLTINNENKLKKQTEEVTK